jgi:hypothetical protein
MMDLQHKLYGHDFDLAFSAVLNLLLDMIRISVAKGDNKTFVCVRQALALVENETPTDTAGVH